MKRYLVWTGIVLVVIVTGITIARAEARGGHRWCGHGWRQHGPLGLVVHQLDLSDAQTTQIKSLWQAERPAVASLVHEFAAENKEMDAATAQGNLDENKVQEIAARQGATVAKLLVEKERLRSKVYTSVLSPEQRTKAGELEKRWHSRLDRIADRLGDVSGKG